MRRAERESLFTLSPTREWTKPEENYLLFRCEKYTVEELADRLNRTPKDIRARLKLLDLEASCGVYTLNRASQTTGYDKAQLERARVGLAMRWRVNSSGFFAITEDQLKDLCDYLRDEGRVLAA